MSETKAAIRHRILDQRRELPAEVHTRLSRAIARRLDRLPDFDRAKVVHIFVGAIDGEVATREIIRRALARGKRIVCPRIAETSSDRMEALEITSLEDLVAGRRGLWEPRTGHCGSVDPAALDLAIVPGIAFDRRGYRIGYGGGHYDRFLPETKCPAVGLAFSLQIVDRVPHTARDVPVDWLATEAETIDCRRNRNAAMP